MSDNVHVVIVAIISQSPSSVTSSYSSSSSYSYSGSSSSSPQFSILLCLFIYNFLYSLCIAITCNYLFAIIMTALMFLGILVFLIFSILSCFCNNNCIADSKCCAFMALLFFALCEYAYLVLFVYSFLIDGFCGGWSSGWGTFLILWQNANIVFQGFCGLIMLILPCFLFKLC
jgi:hypothetical protein